MEDNIKTGLTAAELKERLGVVESEFVKFGVTASEFSERVKEFAEILNALKDANTSAK